MYLTLCHVNVDFSFQSFTEYKFMYFTFLFSARRTGILLAKYINFLSLATRILREVVSQWTELPPSTTNFSLYSFQLPTSTSRVDWLSRLYRLPTTEYRLNLNLCSMLVSQVAICLISVLHALFENTLKTGSLWITLAYRMTRYFALLPQNAQKMLFSTTR